MNVAKNNLFVVNAAAVAAENGHAALEVVADPSQINGNGNGVRIRPYRDSDRAAVHRLCCDTGFLGGPVDPLFRDRELFAELFTRPYLDYEPDWVWVADDHGEPVGYLLGSINRRFDVTLLRSGLRTTTKILLRLAGGKYNDHPRSRQFIRWLLTAGFWEQPRHPRNAAHLHLQIDKPHRAHGLARRLFEKYEERVRQAGVKQCYGAFFSCPSRRPELAYARYGFNVYDRRRTTLFEPEIREAVEVVCVSKTL